VDWFANVQHFISAISPKIGVKEMGAFTVVTRTLTALRTANGSAIARNTENSTLLRGMSGSETLIVLTKERIEGVGAARLVSKIDFSRLSIGDRRILDGISLILQKLNSR
jgi:hypothetical protein